MVDAVAVTLGTAPVLLDQARTRIAGAMNAGATPEAVFVCTVQGLRGHALPVKSDRNDGRQLAALYRRQFGTDDGAQPSLASADPEPDVVEPDPADEPEPELVEAASPGRRRPNRTTRAMTVRLEPQLWRRARRVALSHDRNVSSLIREALASLLDQLEVTP